MSPRFARRARIAALVAALGGTAALAAPAREHLPAPADAVRWLAPLDGAMLPAGGTTELAFELGAGWEGAPALREWEVFLSVDGGRTWSVRLTPHLDLATTRIAVRLPDLVTGDARLLLRIGDERIEYEQLVPVALEIRASGGPRLDRAAPARPSFERGEAGRPGRRGVALWATAERTGGSYRWVWYAGGATLGAGGRWGAGHALPPWGAPASAPRLAAAAIDVRAVGAAVAALSRCLPAFAGTTATALPPLAASCRRNE